MSVAEQVNDPAVTIAHPVAKGISAGMLTLGGLTLGEWLAVAGLIYNMLLIGEFLWKKLIRPWAEARGLIKSTAAKQVEQCNE